jgi:hypothetical protein
MAGSGDVPPLVEDRLRAVCLGLPGAYEELAWTGIRWRVRGRTFAHACTVEATGFAAVSARRACRHQSQPVTGARQRPMS